MRGIVEQILADVDAHKDAAVRELSQKFDRWRPTSFKLAPSEVERATGKCPSAISTTLEADSGHLDAYPAYRK